MERFERAFSWVRTITAGILVVSFGSIEEGIAKSTNGRGEWPYLLAFIIASVLFRGIEKAVELTVENTLWLRRLIAGKHFLEGYWKDIVSDETGGPIYAGIVLLYYEDGRLKVSGRDYNEKESIGDFRSTAAEYKEGELHFTFHYERELGESSTGVASFIFGMNQPTPLSFRGEFFDPALKSRCKVYGEKVLDDRELEACAKLDENAALVAKAYLYARRGE